MSMACSLNAFAVIATFERVYNSSRLDDVLIIPVSAQSTAMEISMPRSASTLQCVTLELTVFCCELYKVQRCHSGCQYTKSDYLPTMRRVFPRQRRIPIAKQQCHQGYATTLHFQCLRQYQAEAQMTPPGYPDSGEYSAKPH